MINLQTVALVGIVVAVVVIAALVAYYVVWLARTKRRTGRVGIVQRSRLTCPKCGGTFDYDWVPGAALNAFRLGTGRYMACPVCNEWSTFDLRHSLVPPS